MYNEYDMLTSGYTWSMSANILKLNFIVVNGRHTYMSNDTTGMYKQ